MKSATAYKIDNLNALDTPAMVVYPSIIKRNIQQLIQMFDDVQQLRPHVKTHKCPQVVGLLLNAGISKFKCATIAEAEMLADGGAADVLLAYQPVGPKVERFINLIIKYPDCLFSCLIDDRTAAEQISEAAQRNSVHANCFLDLNVGMDRTGVIPGHEAVSLFLYCSGLAGVTVVGVHAYDGHVTDSDVSVRLSRAEAGFSAVRNLIGELNDTGRQQLRIVAGSTPTIPFYARQAAVECSPGTFIYWDQHYQTSYPDLPFENAAAVLMRVISKPTPTTACLDLGYKAISSEGGPTERVSLLGLAGTAIISQSEEHLLISSDTDDLCMGEVIYGLPYHVGRTCNLYEESSVVEERKVIGQWHHTARVRQLST